VDDELAIPPAKILEERGRGTLITNPADQGRLLQYWAWLQQPIDVGVLVPIEKFKIGYWMPIALQPVPGDEDPLTYVRVLKELWLEKLRRISARLAQSLALLGDDFGFRLRYVFNGLRIWFAPNPAIQSGIVRPWCEHCHGPKRRGNALILFRRLLSLLELDPSLTPGPWLMKRESFPPV
jgi:hypothetical protein